MARHIQQIDWSQMAPEYTRRMELIARATLLIATHKDFSSWVLL